MRLLKTHSHTSERPGYEARKNAKKVIEGNVDTVRRQTSVKTCRVPRVWRGGETKKALWQDQRHPNYTKTDQLPISEVFTGLPRPYHHKSPHKEISCWIFFRLFSRFVWCFGLGRVYWCTYYSLLRTNIIPGIPIQQHGLLLYLI